MREAGRRGLRAGAGLLAALVLVALAAPWLATEEAWLARGPEGLHSPVLRSRLGTGGPPGREVVLAAPMAGPARVALDDVLEAPSRRHWLGTDGLGRDVAARILHGARTSLAVGILTALLALAAGLPLGAVAGYRGGWTDAAISRVVEAVLCLPGLLVALALLAVSPVWLGRCPDVLRMALVLGVTGWIPVARYLRGEFLRIRGSDMVAAARAAGAGHLRVAVRHILPSALAPVLVTSAFAVGSAILLEAALSFLGLGVRPPTASWGGMLAEARTHVDRAWWLALFPGIALFASVLACNLLAEGIRDRLDPRTG